MTRSWAKNKKNKNKKQDPSQGPAKTRNVEPFKIGTNPPASPTKSSPINHHPTKSRDMDRTGGKRNDNENSEEYLDPTPAANISWLFSKEYYRGFEQTLIQIKEPGFDPAKEEDTKAAFFQKKNEAIIEKRLDNYSEETALLRWCDELNEHTVSFQLTSGYPGLFTGGGAPHETGSQGELKLGFYFDHTTGLPVIPGSSVKGVLRSAFSHPEYIVCLLEDHLKGLEKKAAEDTVKTLELEIFEGVTSKKDSLENPIRLPAYKRDIFFDAVLVTTGNEMGKFLGEDFITPHKDNPFGAPVPLAFLKVLPEVTFRFTFRLRDTHTAGIALTAEDKKNLFEVILRDLGIGAKTNVGYGKFQ